MYVHIGMCILSHVANCRLACGKGKVLAGGVATVAAYQPFVTPNVM